MTNTFLCLVFCLCVPLALAHSKGFYDNNLQTILSSTLVQTRVDPTTTLASRQACVNTIIPFLDPNCAITVYGVGSFVGPILAAEYFCAPGVELVGRPAGVSITGYQSSLIDSNPGNGGNNNRTMFFFFTLNMAPRVASPAWNDTMPNPFGIAPLNLSNTFPYSIEGRVNFNGDGIVTSSDIFVNDPIGLYAFTQNSFPPGDQFFPISNFCAQILTACEATGHPTGYGSPTTFLSCVLYIRSQPSSFFFLGSPEYGANTFSCRVAHLALAFLNPDIHCPHAAAVSTMCTSTALILP